MDGKAGGSKSEGLLVFLPLLLCNFAYAYRGRCTMALVLLWRRLYCFVTCIPTLDVFFPDSLKYILAAFAHVTSAYPPLDSSYPAVPF